MTQTATITFEPSEQSHSITVDLPDGMTKGFFNAMSFEDKRKLFEDEIAAVEDDCRIFFVPRNIKAHE